MFKRLLATLCLLLPLTAGAVYFPGGVDWTNPSQNRFVQSLYLNMLGRAPDTSESRDAVRTLRRNDNRTARLRLFESILQTSEYQRGFDTTDRSWQVFQAPDYNYNNGSGFYRYQAAQSRPEGFTDLPGGSRSFSKSIAQSVAHYYDAFCYRGDPCINNPELARDRGANVLTQTTARNAHACSDTSKLNSQFKWVAINGTTYPRGIDRDTICLDDSYFKAEQLDLQRYDCDSGYVNCKRNRRLDLRASRSGTDNDGHPSLFFRDGSRLALIQTDNATDNSITDNSGVVVTNTTDSQPTDPLLAGDAHACSDPSQTTTRFTWQGPSRSAESKGIDANIICMDNYYYAVQRLTLFRHNCGRGFTNCQPDPDNNLTAEGRTSVNGKPALRFANGTTVALTARNLPPESTTVRSDNTSITNSQLQVSRGTDCALPKKRLSQFRWKSNGLSSWPDGVDGRFICLNDSFYEVSQTRLRNYNCERNYTNCIANPGKDFRVSQVSEDGMVWILDNGDQITLITK